MRQSVTQALQKVHCHGFLFSVWQTDSIGLPVGFPFAVLSFYNKFTNVIVVFQLPLTAQLKKWAGLRCLIF